MGATKYVDEEGEVILDTDYGSDDVIIVPEENQEDFEELVSVAEETGSLEDFDDPHWNDNIRATFLGYEKIEDMEADLSFASNKFTRQALIEVIQNDNPVELLEFVGMQWASTLANPMNWIPSPIKGKGLNIKPPINRTIPSNNLWVRFNQLSVCKEEGIAPEKPFKGSFNVRIPTELHQKAALLAMEEKMSLNNFVVESIRERVLRESETRN